MQNGTASLCFCTGKGTANRHHNRIKTVIYKLQLEPGKYDLVFSIIGYKTQVITHRHHQNYEQQIIMQLDEESMMGTVQVTGIKKDHAEEYVRNVIRNKDAILVHRKTTVARFI